MTKGTRRGLKGRLEAASSGAIMIQGTCSDAGKSTLVAGLCRIALQRGFKVAPFKPQNMSNNAAACSEGGEIGRAQAMQAKAAGIAPSVDMNPVLLKPQSDRTSQVVLQGKALTTLQAADYMRTRAGLLERVMESFERLRRAFDLVIVEGAGSAAEINLRTGDIANMGFARRARLPVCLLGDIDRGGVIAAVVGTRKVLDPADAALITRFAINRFRGDPALFDEGVREMERRTGWPCAGVIPWLDAARRLPQEDAVIDEAIAYPGASDRGSIPVPKRSCRDRVRIAVPLLSRIANFDDFDPLRLEPAVDFAFVPPGRPLPRHADVVILPGTKSTIGDLAFLRAQGWDHDLIAHARSGGRVLGLCGGYQMLGRRVCDPEGIDGSPGEVQGLGLLDIETVMGAEKSVCQVVGKCARSGVILRAYEIHVGVASGPDTRRPFARLMLGLARGGRGRRQSKAQVADRPEGAVSADGRIEGTHLHGLFAGDTFRSSWLSRVGSAALSSLAWEAQMESALDALAAHIERSLDVDALFDDAFGVHPARCGPQSIPASETIEEAIEETIEK
ncbi:cobyric acid synthase [Thioalkalivibrio sp. HK1]|uniref:cobyric acid synthase n=1 Tax=Thioalkalivibrio sp. HK1 TaxID=1469245 RepID=UPI000470F5FF|nr:cobyric acid synthase [Thioalkalivibrio sp. HK1]